MTSIDADVWTRFREAGARAYDEEVSRRAEFLSDLTQLSRSDSERLVRSGEIPLHREADITSLVNVYGAAVNPDNSERTGVRTSVTLDAIASALPSHLEAVRGLSYQYCVLCGGTGGVQAFFTSEHLDHAVVAAITRSNPNVPIVTVEHANNSFVVMSAYGGAGAHVSPVHAALWMYSLHEGHPCMTGRTASVELFTGVTTRFVNMALYAPDAPSLDMRVSSLLRCPNQPTRHLDMDMLLFDHRRGAVVGVVEHAHMGHTRNLSHTDEQDQIRCWAEVESKPTTQTRAAALRFGCAAYRVIDHTALGTVAHLLEGAAPQLLGGIDELLAHITRT